jgi:multiple sugar transport system permease protein
MVLPAVVFAAAMIVFPFGYAVWLSFSEFTLGQPPRLSGVQNYARLVADPDFWNGLRLTLALYAVSLTAQLVIGTWLGLLLARSNRARGIARTILVSPFMLPPVVVGMMAIVILDPSFSLPSEVFEAAEVDGAQGWQRFRHITLPLLGPTLVTAAVLRSVDLLRFFDVIYLTTQGGPGTSSTTLNILAYRRGFEFFDLGYASAIMVTLSAIVFGSVLVFARLRRVVTW